MKTKKSHKKEESDSSSESASSTDSSTSGSESRNSSPVRKKSKKEPKTKHAETPKVKSTDVESSISDDKKKEKAPKCQSDDEVVLKAKREAIEHSRWDSPADKAEKKPRNSEKGSRSQSEDVDAKTNEKVDEHPERRHKEKKVDHDKEKPDERDRSHHERYERRFDRNRNSRQYENRSYNDRYDNRRDNRDRGDKREYRDRKNDHVDRKHGRDRSDSRDRNRNRRDDQYNRNDGHESKNRNRRRRSRSDSFNHSDAKWGKDDDGKSKQDKSKDKEKPNFGLSGKLTEERNTFKGVVIKYSEPPEARKPKRRWRLYPFKGEKAMQTLYIHRESAYLIGRDRKVVDLPVDHPSCSKQHAVLQYRLVPFTRDDGSAGKRVRPYIIDLESANGTYLNNKKIDPKKFVELLEKDVLKFGYSSREYVLLHENSKDEAQDDDVKIEEEVVVKKED